MGELPNARNLLLYFVPFVFFVDELRFLRLKELARVQAQRHFIEHAFREAKSECGMAGYQVRCRDAWHHHMALVMPATPFLVKQKMAHHQTWPMLSLNDLVTAIAHMCLKPLWYLDEAA